MDYLSGSKLTKSHFYRSKMNRYFKKDSGALIYMPWLLHSSIKI